MRNATTNDHAHCKSGKSGITGPPRRLGGQEVSQERATLGPLLANLPLSKRGIGICLLGNPVQEIASFRADASLVPNLRFPSVDSDVTMVEQLLLNSVVRHTHPRRFSLNADVVQKSEDFFGRVQPSLSGQQSWVLSQTA